MILECPECRTRYLVPDSAIGSEGRTVRCAKCRHSWYQEGTPPVEPTTVDAPASDEAAGGAAAIPPAATAPPPAPSPADAPMPPIAEVLASRPVAPAATRPRRNPVRRNTALAFAAGLVLLAAIALILWLGTPNVAGRLGLGGATTPLRIKDNPIERRELENGSELFAISGQVTNPSAERQRVPDIRAELRDARCRLVFSWTITPQVRTVAPGGAVEFNSAKLDVPSSSKSLELSFAGEDGDAAHRCAG